MSLLLSTQQENRTGPFLRWLPLLTSRRARIGIPLGYLALIAVAELLTTLGQLRAGLVLHGVLLVMLLVQASLTAGDPSHRLLLGLALAPLIRMLSLSLPLVRFPQLYWYLIISIPLFVASALMVRVLGYSRQQLGFTISRLPVQLLAALAGVTLGVTEYYILKPETLLENPNWLSGAVAGLILLVCTGFGEEFMFRGLIQRASIQTLGRFGLLYTALLFAVLHIGYHSVADVVFVFSVALLFGWIAESTWSLLGVTLAHGITNIVLFLVMPALFG
jgi:membrane protease YdiL (CAAX protease family)